MLTHLNYAFALPDETGKISLGTTDLLTQVVAQGHAKGISVLLSVGGWSGSRYFSNIAASADLRKTFVGDCVTFVQNYNLDGIDIDWEFVGKKGMDCNNFSAQDSDNQLLLLQDLRSALDSQFGPASKLITLAVRIEPFIGPDGQPLSDVSNVVPYVDLINIMAYDINGSWSTTSGANAPISGPQSVQSSIDAWTGAGWPAKKITMGLAMYGRSFTVAEQPTTISAPFSKPQQKGDNDDALWADPCPNAEQVYSGLYKWTNLRAQGVLTAPDTAGDGWTRNWDDDSQTPWLYNDATKTLVTYDDTQSLKQKVNYALGKGLAGVMLWELSQQLNNELLQTIYGECRQN